MTEPVVTALPEPPLSCAYTHAKPRLATHDVDGTSVCRAHLAEAIMWARGRRAGR